MPPCLHILNKAPEQPRAWHCLAQLQDGDRLVLMENALLALADENWTASVPEGVTVRVMAADLEARGLTQHLKKGMQTIDYKDFVTETAAAEKLIHW